jgi:hypothetical protein
MRNHAKSYADASVLDLSATQVATISITISITSSDIAGDVWSSEFISVDIKDGNLHYNARMQLDDADQPPTPIH